MGQNQDRGDPERVPRPLRQSALMARGVGLYTMIPIMLVVGPVAGWMLGHWLEGRWGHDPWLGLAGIVLGGAASVRQVILILQRAQRSGPGPKGPQR